MKLMKHHLLTLVPLVAACAAVPVQPPPALDPGPGLREVVRLSATGVQVYECRASTAAAGSAAWVFVAPEAQLFDAQGRNAGSHGAGPNWVAPDGSSVVGAVQARADAPAAGAIPWLLLNTRSTGGAGAFERVSRIQRVNTEGGVAPAQGCTAASIGAQSRVPYRAEYRLFAPV